MERQDKIPIMFEVDLSRYAGRWYEIARSPFEYESFSVTSNNQRPPFAVECQSATADYATIETPNGTGLTIVNRCFDGTGAEISRVSGVASPVSNKELGALLRVVFDDFTVTTPNGQTLKLPTSSDRGEKPAGYWIHWLSDDYSLAIVGSPDTGNRGDTLSGQVWILSRTPQVYRSTLDHIVSKIREIGYNPDMVLANPNVVV